MTKDIFLYIPALVVSVLAGALLFLSHGELVLGIIPIALFMFLVMFCGVGRVITEQRFLIAFVFIAFFIDDCSTRSWHNVPTLTVLMGNLLYQTVFGLNGMETTAMLFAAWLILTQRAQMRVYWLHLGLLPMMLLTVLVITVCALSAAHGLMAGGDFKTVVIQMRFMHLLPLWTFIGFVMISNAEYGNKLLKAFAFTMIFKGFQGLFVYFTHHDFFLQMDYLLNHFASALWVVAVAYYVNYVAHLPISWRQKLWRFALLIPTFICYIINNRRTAVIGLGLTTFSLLVLLPKEWLKQQLKKLAILAVVLPLFIGATWNMPKNGLGFLSNTFKSLLFSDREITDSRNIENYNLFWTVIDHPLAGIGIGNEYHEYMKLPSIESVYKRDQIMPHNGILFFWTYNGPLGMAAVGTFYAFIIGAFGRLMRKKGSYPNFLMGTTSLFLGIQYLGFTFGDMSFQNNAAQCLVGLMFGGAMRILAELREETTLVAGLTRETPGAIVANGLPR